MDSDEENVLSNKAPPANSTLNNDVQSSVIPGKASPYESENDSRDRLLQKSVQALDEDWKIGSMPGDGLNLPTKDESRPQRRKSMRLDIIDQASAAVEMTTSVLGKRGREVMEAGMEKIQAWKGSHKRDSRRSTDIKQKPSNLPNKRARFSASYPEKKQTPHPHTKVNAARKRSKHWVAQGLYVGQSPDFDARLTGAKNKLKRASGKVRSLQNFSAMPLPMFAGERTLALGRDFKLPFDVFSPLPPGQPKPDEWKKTHKSMYISSLPLWSILISHVQMFSLVMQPIYGKRLNQWSTRCAFVKRRMVVMKIALIVSCSTNVMTTIATLVRSIAQTAPLLT